MAPKAGGRGALRWFRVLGVLVVLHVTQGAAAQTETRRARADRLFSEGKAALDAERYVEACTKLEESQELDPATGTLLALAICHEGQGRIATALREFKDVAVAADKTRRSDRSALARQRISALERRVPTVIVRPSSNASSPPVQIQLDGRVLTKTEIGAPLPLDPGAHVIEVSQPAHRSVRIPGTVTERQQWTVAIPRLDDLDAPPSAPVVAATPPPPAATTAPPPTPPSPSPAPVAEEKDKEVDVSGPARMVGWVSLGAGVAALGLGAYFGIAALGDRSDAEKLCSASPCTNEEGVHLNDTAKTEAWIANFGIGLGIVGVGVGSYLLLRRDAPSEPRHSGARIVPIANATGAGLMVDGRF